MFGKKTVDGVMSAFNKAIGDLHEVRALNDGAAERQEEVANQAIAKRLEHMEESSRATRLIERLTEIVR